MALFDIHRPAGLRRCKDQISLPAEEGRYLENVKHFRGWFYFIHRMDISQNRQLESAASRDAGPVVKVKISIDKEARRATVDFTGTSSQQPWNFNAPAAVTRAAVLYVFRTLVDDDIPMNEGCLKPIEIVLPGLGRLLPPSGRGLRRQCRDLAMGHRHPLRRLGRACRGAGDDEQLHLRQRQI